MTAPLTASGFGTVPYSPVAGWLKAILAAATGTALELGKAPAGASFPYGVLWPIPGPAPAGGLARPNQMGWQVWQVDAVGAIADQALGTADRFRTALLGVDSAGAWLFDAPIEGYAISQRATDEASGSTPEPSGTDPQQVWTCSDRYRLYVTTV